MASFRCLFSSCLVVPFARARVAADFVVDAVVVVISMIHYDTVAAFLRALGVQAFRRWGVHAFGCLLPILAP